MPQRINEVLASRTQRCELYRENLIDLALLLGKSGRVTLMLK